MSRGLPSMTALLGLLAVAGYQNRDKIAEILGELTRGDTSPGDPATGGMLGRMGTTLPGQSASTGAAGGGLGSILGGLAGAFGGAGAGNVIAGGLSDLVDSFRKAGQGEVADSWVASGPNRDVAPSQLEQAIGPDVLEALARQTGLSKDDLLQRLSTTLPEAVDRFTPNGRLPTADEYRV